MKKVFIVPVFLFFFASVFAQITTSELNTVTQPEKASEETPVSVEKSFKIEEFGFPLPSKYRKNVTSEQGLRDAISSENTGGLSTSGKWHNGIDYAVPEKTPVYAAKGGVVSTVYPSYFNGPVAFKGHPVYGGLIIIKHDDGTISLYGHLSYTEVKEQQRVEKGQEIGWSGGKKGQRGSGSSTGPHLHFSVYMDMDQFITQ